MPGFLSFNHAFARVKSNIYLHCFALYSFMEWYLWNRNGAKPAPKRNRKLERFTPPRIRMKSIHRFALLIILGNLWLNPAGGEPQLETLPAVTLEWMGENGKLYQVEASADGSTWTSEGWVLAGEGQAIRRTYATDGATRWYRVRELPPGELGLVWADEFDGNRLDRTIWSNLQNGEGGGNNELQYYTMDSDNLEVSDGTLKITARKETYTDLRGSTFNWTSARIRTFGTANFLYGRIEVRAKFPAGRGFWPAAWLMPRDSVYGGWAASGEIDIVENRGDEPNEISGTIHFGGSWPDNTSAGNSYTLPEGNVNDTFRVYAIEWEPEAIRWYVDGELYSTQTEWFSSGGAYPAPFDQPFYFILNLAVGGWFAGEPDASTPSTGVMEVDYVRYYRRAE